VERVQNNTFWRNLADDGTLDLGSRIRPAHFWFMVEFFQKRLMVVGALLTGLLICPRVFAGDLQELLPTGARLGMEQSEMSSVRPTPTRLDVALVFGPLRAEFIDPDFTALGSPGILYFQFDSTSVRLRQFLFEWRDAAASQFHTAELFARLRAKLGAPTLICIHEARGTPSHVVAARWRSAALMLQVSIFDHRGSGVARYDLNSDADPRRPSHERRRITRRSLPRRLVARLHAADDIDLIPRRDCPEGSIPETR